ncbi:hypothetical protein COO60DRAFT_1700790 [Scenedesmus sp. NREL 46B-D3]|nr:hypothetical protein COO60DRAFT_1700790 [Scenedesmus sp. NREL 46B-D3]
MGSMGDPMASRSDYSYLGPHPPSGGAAHSVESLLEMIAGLPAHQDCAAVVGSALQHLDSSALAALMKELGRAGLFKRSVELFDFLRRQNSPEYTHLLDIYTYTTAIAVCSASQQLQRALDLMAEMRARGITCNVHTYSALMNVCIKCNEVGLVQQVYKQMIQEGCTPNLWQEAIKLLDKLEEEGIQPEVRTYNTIITACNKSGKPEQGLKVYERMVAKGVKASATTYTALISAYGKQGMVEKAMDIFADMVQRGCGHWEKAKECFNQMLAQNCRPDGITFSALITAYQRGEQWREALQAFSHMPANGCHPDSVVYNALLEVCWGSGVLPVQMRATQIWSLANRSGHFRIYNQNKGDPTVHQHSCVVFTCGAAIVTLLRWLCDVRHKVAHDATSLLRDSVLFSLQKGKASRIEQPSSVICESVRQLLAGHSSPFTVRLVDSATQLEAASSELVAWLRSPAFAPLAYLVHANSVKRLSVEQLVAEDVALDKSCTDALSYVRTYEQLRGYHKQLQPNMHDPLGTSSRQQLLDLALHYGSCFRFQPETCYDAWELLQRLLMAGATPPLGTNAAQWWRLMLVACMMIACKQPAAELPGAIPTYDVVSLNTGFSADNILSCEANIRLVLSSDASAVSALRVCQVLLERLGGQHQEGRQAGLITEDLHAMLYRVACSGSMFRVQPSLVAMAIMYCLRSKRGLVPLWPAALVQLTAIYDPTVGDLGLLLEQVRPLVGPQLAGPPAQQQQQQQQPVAPAAPAPGQQQPAPPPRPAAAPAAQPLPAAAALAAAPAAVDSAIAAPADADAVAGTAAPQQPTTPSAAAAEVISAPPSIIGPQSGAAAAAVQAAVPAAAAAAAAGAAAGDVAVAPASS